MSRRLLSGVPFVRGVNLPWLSYGNDFGCNAWHPEGGIAEPQRRAIIESVFARLAAARVDLVRWFLLCDGRSGICVDDEGGLAGLDERAFVDFRTAVALAEAHDVALMPVLLDFHWCHAPREHDGVRLGGRAADLVDSGRRARLLHHVLRPLLSRFGGRRGIGAWDLVNEPEFVTFSWRTWDPRHSVLPDIMSDYIGEVAALVHECTDHPATVGLSCTASLPLVRGLGLDFHQVHWYDTLEHECPLAAPIAALDLEAPVLLGEFPTDGARQTPEQIEQTARGAGYAGCLAWSLLADDEASDGEAAWAWLERENPVPGRDARTQRLERQVPAATVSTAPSRHG